MAYKLLVAGHTCIDIVIVVDKLPDPETSTEIVQREERPGGNALNIGVAAAQLGVDCGILSLVGRDYEEECKSILSRWNVRSFLVVHENLPTTRVYAIHDPTGTRYLVEEGVSMLYEASPFKSLKNMIATALEYSTVVHLAAGKPSFHLWIAREAQRRRRYVVLDPGQEIRSYTAEALKELLTLGNLLFCNEVEARRIENLLGKNIEHLTDFLEAIIVTRGSKGVHIIADSKKIDACAIPPKQIVNTIGAGDSFRAGFHAARSRGLELAEAVIVGIAAATAHLEQPSIYSHPLRWSYITEVLTRIDAYQSIARRMLQ
ncbi:hypothetical protein DRN94_002450 [archaeon]|nr:hypothetical protein [archaeon]